MVQLLKSGYKLLVADFDGTLAMSDKTVSLAVKNAIDEYVNEGGVFVVCSGRALHSTRLVMAESRIKGMVACCHGAVVADENGVVLARMEMSCEKAVSILDGLEKEGVFYIVFINDEVFCNFDCESRLAYERISGCGVAIVPNLKEKIVAERLAVQNILVIGEAKELEQVRNVTESSLPKGTILYMSQYNFLEIVDERSTKGKALEFLLKHLGIEKSASLAVGDTSIDLPMMRSAGLGVAVANATEDCKKGADTVCKYTNNEDALAKIILTKEWSI